MKKLYIFDAWKNSAAGFFAPKSAQGYNHPAMAVSASCGSSCGAGDEEPNPASCGSSCGAGDEEPNPNS